MTTHRAVDDKNLAPPPVLTISVLQTCRMCVVLSTRLLYTLITANTFRCPSGPWFNIKMSSYQHRKFNCGDEAVVKLSYHHKGISYTGNTTSLYWNRTLDTLSMLEFNNYGSNNNNQHLPGHKPTHMTICIPWRFLSTGLSISWSALRSAE